MPGDDGRPMRRQDDREVPDWAVELMKSVGDMRVEFESRLSRIESGIAFAGFLVAAALAVAAILHGGS